MEARLSKTAIERYAIILGFLVLKVVSLVVKLLEEPPLEKEVMWALYGEMAVIAPLSILALIHFRIPAILLGGYMLLGYGLSLVFFLWGFLFGGYFPSLFQFLSWLFAVLLVLFGYRLLRMEITALRKAKGEAKESGELTAVEE